MFKRNEDLKQSMIRLKKINNEVVEALGKLNEQIEVMDGVVSKLNISPGNVKKGSHEVALDVYRGIERGNYYEAIFTDDFAALNSKDQELVIGMVLDDFKINFKELVDNCVKEMGSK
ncbi:hypothetical protein [Metabacillus sp. cB07]|uniref:hypothetical protein n=1 Tax=Metabacillus sp. cB07 TaxID=2806989 RepID=UPI00193A9E20|nr:hypothetical protein [Metabacillus sp. cB07]